MKIRLADYVADFLVKKGITDCFMVVGGGAMHLNDALGHKDGLRCVFQHHEQASAIAAEGYARLENKPALCCVTTGPGGTNAITGVVGAWLDSIPMFVLSGQVRYDTTSRYCESFTAGMKLRAVGDQEYDITESVANMCKYAVMIEKPEEILYHLQRAWHLMSTGRPGPVWLDIPVNFQGMEIETEGLKEYDPAEDADVQDAPKALTEETVQDVLDMIKAAKRPVFYAGWGIRLSGAYECFRRVVDKLGIPVCTYWDAIDLIETDHPLYCGRAGNMGDRPGNFAVQNADVILAVGNRLPIRVTGYNFNSWAREAKVIMVDIDAAELKKPTIHVEKPIHADAADFLDKMEALLDKEKQPFFEAKEGCDWCEICRAWKRDYPAAHEGHKKGQQGYANAYDAFDRISRALPEDAVTVTSNGTCCVAGHQTWYIKKGSRFFNNNAIASMGYGLPAAIGACYANKLKEIICLEGDGSIMMNLQELQTLVTNDLPVKIYLINNSGYHSIRQTQSNLFGHHTRVGIGPESGDLSFPSYEKLAAAFGIPYMAAHANEEVDDCIAFMAENKGPAICEIFVSPAQFFEPKNSARKTEDGRIVSPPLEDLAPFLPREEFLKNMYITPLEESVKK